MRKNSIFLLSFILFSGLSFPVQGFSFGFGFGHKTVKSIDGEVRLALSDVSDGEAHHFSYKGAGKIIKFFVVNSPDGTLRAAFDAFDACDVCFPAKKGYTQEGDFMICKNCGRKFHSNRVNVVEGDVILHL